MEKTYAVINHDMKANELRIGNWAIYEGEPFMVKWMIQIEGNWCAILDKVAFNVPLSDLKPIPLTEDILLKCGFERLEPNHDEYPNGGYDLRTVVIYRKGIFTYNTSHGWWINRKHMYSKLTDMELHQLQNLYFAITKEELEVNL